MNNVYKLLKNNVSVSNITAKSYLHGIWKPRKSPVIGVDYDKKKNIKQILEEERPPKDPKVHYLVNIGLPFTTKANKKERSRRNAVIQNNLSDNNMGKLSKENKLEVSLEDVYDEWITTEGPQHIKRIAEHYDIFNHLFGDAYFYPVTDMRISFKSTENEYTPVYFGNHIKPNEAQNAPLVDIGNKSDVLHTLVLSSLDSHLNKPDGEYVHWMIGNITDGDLSKGELIYSYLAPFPTKGTGYHRYVFILYQQDKKLDFSGILDKTKNLNDLENREFNTYEFYRERQDFITPSSLLFFQSDYDSYVTDIFHNIFNIPEPRFEYDFPKSYEKPQEWFPKKQPFNLYMDRYRDPKQISKEVLIKKLKTHHPFIKPDPPLKFPHAHTPYDHAGKPSWIQVAVKKERLGWGRIYNDNKDIIDPK